jgi:hypothetical protein
MLGDRQNEVGSKNELIEEFRFNLLKDNLMCDKDRAAVQVKNSNNTELKVSLEQDTTSSNFIKNLIISKVDQILSNGSMQDKMNLYYAISSDNRSNLKLSQLSEGADSFSLCKPK